MRANLFRTMCWLMTLLPGVAVSQELIPNGSFETYRTCPRLDNLLEEAVPWYNPNRATPDFYNYCFPTSQIEVPPHSGQGLARLFLDQGWAEYLATPLTRPLVAGQCYYFETYITTREPNKYLTATIGAYFSNQPITSTAKDFLNVRPQILDSETKTVTKASQWERIRGYYEAKGGEQFVTIGSFNKTPAFLSFYYLFLDDISLRPIELNLGNDTTLCGRKSTYLLKVKTAGATDYKWNDGSTEATYLVKKPGKYWVTVTTPCKTLSDTINVDYVLDFSLGADTTLCNGQRITLNAPPDVVNYHWQDGSSQRTYTVKQAGTYSLEVRQAGCVVSDSIHIQFIKPPELSLGPNKELCGAETFTLKPRFAEGTFAWQDKYAQPERTFSNSGTFRATVTNACATAHDSIDIDYGECGCVIYAPDLFTPNADGQNDVFHPFACGDITIISLSIFNRWGELVFRSTTAPFQWDGWYKGTLSAAGVYAWQVDYMLSQREKVTQKRKEGRLVLTP